MNSNDTTQVNGYTAANPGAIPRKGWKEILLRVKDKIKNDNVAIVSAGVAFYFFLALFPAIAATFSIYGLVVEPDQVEQQLKQAADALPAEAHQMVTNLLKQTAQKSSATLSWSLLLSILFSLWSANKATTAAFIGINIAYHEKDDRNFFKKAGITLLFTFGAIVTGIIAVASVIAFPALIDKLGLPTLLQEGLALLRWVILGGLIFFVIAMMYKIAPDRATPQFKWVKTGAIIATIVWLGGSLLFTFYITNFGNYDKTYGSIAAVIILLLWFFLTGFIILIGAEINAEIEHQTTADTTTGSIKPMGKRGAYYADHVASGGKKKESN